MVDALEIANEIKTLSETVSEPLPKEVEGLLTEGEYRAQWLARIGELEADAQAALDIKRGEVADQYADLTATLFREKLAGATADNARLVMLAHRMYTTLTNQLIFIETAISWHKAQRGR